MTSPLEHFFEQAARRAAEPDAAGTAASPATAAAPAAGAMADTAVSIACPGCRRLVAVGAPCPSCGLLPAPPAVRHDLTVVLDPAPDVTMELPVVQDDEPMREPLYGRADRRPPPPAPAVRAAPPPPEPAAPVPVLVPVPAPMPVPAPTSTRPPAQPPVARSRRAAGASRGKALAGRRPPVAVLAAAGALVLVAGAAVAGLRSGADRDERTTPAASAAPAAVAVRVPGSAVRASASTSQRPDGAISYAAANTLDGRPETAWNSRGQGAGAWLSYTFAKPVDLASITVLNGYQKARPGRSGGVVDLFALNERLRVVRVVTDGGSVEWTLRDDRAPQTLTRAFGRTRTVRLQVVSTYPSAKYDDLGVSEVQFTAR